MKATAEESARYEEAFNQLAQFRFQRNGRPDADGATRWRCPICAGHLRSRQVPKSMRGSRNRPLVALPDGATCCTGTVTASVAELAHWQRFLPGTTAWRISYGRRQVVEGVNAMLKGGFVNIQHKFFRVLGLAKMTLLMAFTLGRLQPRGHPLVPREEGGRAHRDTLEEDEEEASDGDVGRRDRLRSSGVGPCPAARLTSSSSKNTSPLMKGVTGMVG